MSEEIKDILEHLSATQKINNGWTSFSDKECKLLYDYITNLQQKEIREMLYKRDKDDYDIYTANVLCDIQSDFEEILRGEY